MLKGRFEKLTYIQKIELYILVVLFFGTIVYFSEDLLQNIMPHKQQTSIYKTRLNAIKTKIEKSNTKKVLNFIQKYTQDRKIFLNSVEVEKYRVVVNLEGSYDNLINLLYLFDIHLKIEKFELERYEKHMRVFLTIDTKYFYNPNFIFKNDIKFTNPFVKVRVTKKIKHKSKPKQIIKISAIVGDEVLILNRWYKKGEIVDRYKILNIGINSVDMVDIDSGKKLTLGIYDG